MAPDHPLAELLADLRRDRLFERLSLEGLDRNEVEALIAAHAGQAVSSALAQTVHSETEGNPFFVEEVVRHLIETGQMFGTRAATSTPAQIGVPEGVKEVLARRLARLSETCRSVLSQAAVLGREFRFELLPAMAELDDDAVIGALEEALGARLIVEGEIRLRLHARARPRGALRTAQRSEPSAVHARAALAIEAADGGDHDARIAALALHYRLGGRRSIRRRESPTRCAPESTPAGCLPGTRPRRTGRALELMERDGTEAAERARLLVALAVVCAVLGDLAREIDYLERALGIYVGLGDEDETRRCTRGSGWPTR